LAREVSATMQHFFSTDPHFDYVVLSQSIQFSGNIKDVQVAIDIYDKALTQDPNSPDILTNKGIALMKIGRYNEAMDLFNKALTSDPNHAPALFNKALLLDKMGRTDEGYNLKQRAADIDPTYSGDLINILATSQAFA
jgi:tetratricopeptide (TPR) repeat protein